MREFSPPAFYLQNFQPVPKDCPIGSSPLVTTYTYNAAGDLSGTSYTDSTPAIALTYDRLGRLLTTTDAAGLCTWAYDPVSFGVASETYTTGLLNSLSVTRTFDGFNRLASSNVIQSGAKNLTVAYGYDSASRLQTVTALNSQPSALNLTATYGYIPNSNLVGTLALQNGSTTYLTTIKAYDNLNRLASVSSSATSAGSAFNYGYNSANQRVSATEADGSAWQYGYDPLGQVTSGIKQLAGGAAMLGHSFGYTFDTIGNRLATNINGEASTYTADSAGLNQYQSHTVPALVDITGTADPAANVFVNLLPADRQSGLFHRQLSFNNTSGPVWQPVTVLASRPGAGAGGTDGLLKKTGNVFIAKTPESFSYDLDGNLTADGHWTYTWDAENRLISMQTNAAAVTAGAPNLLLQFTYDAQGRRIQKKVSNWNGSAFLLSSDTRFLYDGWNMAAEFSILNSTFNLSRAYVWGLDLSGSMQGAGGVGGLLAVNTGTATYAPAFDGNGNIVSLVNAADGSDAADFEYDPFGNVLKSVGMAASAQPFGFSTKYTDSETGLDYYGQRYYNPSTGRWLSRDPSGEEGGLNLYGFVKNDPIDNRDSLGLNAVDDAANQAMEDFLFGNNKSYTFGPTHPWTVQMMNHPHMTDVRAALKRIFQDNCAGKNKTTEGPLDFNLNDLSKWQNLKWIIGDAQSWLSDGYIGTNKAYIYGSYRLYWKAWKTGIDCCKKEAVIRFDASDSVHLKSGSRIPKTGISILPVDNPFGPGHPFNDVGLHWYWYEKITF